MRVPEDARKADHGIPGHEVGRRRGPRGVASVCLVLSLLLTAGGTRAATILVNDSGDELHAGPGGCALTGTGTCTLRDAITFANANPGIDGVGFSLGGNETISIGAGGLPPVTDAVGINGAVNVVHMLKIDGAAAGGADGLTISADGCSISNMVVQGFGGAGLRLSGSDTTIGGYCTTACPGGGVRVSGNGGHGILIEGGAGNVVGNFHVEQNGGDGVRIGGGATGNSIGGLYGWLGGTIRSNAGAGVRIGDSAGDAATTGNRILVATTYGNGGLGIDLGGDGVTANDAQDPDSGPNALQNFPVLTSALYSPCSIMVSGTLNSTPDTTFTVELFWSSVPDPSGYGEGESRLDEYPTSSSFSVTTDAQGDAAFSMELAVRNAVEPAPLGSFVTARATANDGGTSEFSPATVVTVPPATGPLGFHSLPPCRVLDTRGAPGPWGGPALVGGEQREFQVAGLCGVPNDAKAVSVNVTVVDPGEGHLAVYPADSPRGCDSTVSFHEHRTRANNAIVGLGTGRVWMYSTEGTHAILDVNGYFR